jgi:polynucleotide 5'-hydroxyl-kinase GRC3/NOL9
MSNENLTMETIRHVGKDETLQVTGPARITVRTGRIRISGADRSKYIVREGHSCMVEGVQESEVSIVLGSGAKVEKRGPVTAPRIWLKHVQEILQKKGVVMIIGAPDTGKTTFASFLANQALEKGISVALIDSDIGQSDIGPPSTIGLAFVRTCIAHIAEVPADEFYFVGTTSVKDVCDMVLGLRGMVEKARKQADLVIIDTCGYVSGDMGRRLKALKLQAVNPDFVVALQRDRELYPILRSWRGNVIPVEIPREVRRVPRHIRKEIRESRWRKTFEGAQERNIDLEEKVLHNTYLLSGDVIDTRIFQKLLQCHIMHAEEIPEGFLIVKEETFHEYQSPHVSVTADTLRILDAGWEENLVVGLMNKGRFVDLGIVKKINYKTMMAVISCREHSFDAIKFGRIKVDESGREIGFIPWC